ncbi:DUF2017 family protein [Nesterenkonia sphaerica]|uniref:DUF2017 family protein n=1 Tax=Nesterenkonia sphaerica TaxID=1804988 RepID=A0A5R9AFX7_9MICC|nr:DUF2017 family protein [Nesterenkonia sphaerica]TLP77478.1 DUF2017 family protein [Nesterenkonia sphaerica]
MARAFRATTRGYRADMETYERRLLSHLCADVISMLEARGQASGDDAATAPEDGFAHFRRELAGLGVDIDGETEESGLEPPADAALARLLPDASGDPAEAAQLRRLSEASLRESKIADLRAARMALESDPVSLSEEQAPVFGRALNAVRLTLAARLEIDDEDDAERVHQMASGSKASTTEEFMAELYTFTTWLQESLFSAMLDVMPDDQ